MFIFKLNHIISGQSKQINSDPLSTCEGENCQTQQNSDDGKTVLIYILLHTLNESLYSFHSDFK